MRFTAFVERNFYAREAALFLRKDKGNAQCATHNAQEIAAEYIMEWRGIRLGMDVYETEIKIPAQGLYFYWFTAYNGLKEIRLGGGADGKGEFVQLVTSADYAASKRLNGGVMYQIFVDRFAMAACHGDTTSPLAECQGRGGRYKTRADAVYRDDWGGAPFVKKGADGKLLNNDFFGGNLDGVIEKLPYLKSLGVACVYLNPIFKAYSNHKYDTGDYFQVDPDFGGNEAFSRLCAAAKKRGIKIILDGVFSHTGADSRYFNKYGKYESTGAYQSKDSPYYKWYNFKRFPDKYDCWWDIDILPAVNEAEPSYDEFINGADGVVAHWLKAGAAGWRLDVADELPDGFLDNLCRRAKKAKKDAVIIGEVWEDAAVKEAYGNRRRYFQGGQLDGTTNYPLREGIISFVTGGGTDALCGAFDIMLTHYPKGAADTLMNVLGTHDTERILTVIKNIKLLKAAAALQFSAPGVPCVYYGDEAGAEGGRDPFCRGCFPWGKENREILAFYKKLGAIRKKHGVFKTGGTEILYAQKDVFIIRRFQETGRGEIITAVNIGDKDFEFVPDGRYQCLLTGAALQGECVLKGGDILILLNIEQ